MKRLSSILVLTTLALGAPALAGPPQVESFHAVLLDTAAQLPEEKPGRNWFSGGGKIWHVRGAQVLERVEPLPGPGTSIDLEGTLERRVSFNWNLATNHSTAWCRFILASPLDTWRGRCGGSLFLGTFVGNGAGRSRIEGVYELQPGGIPAVGPYELRGTIANLPD